MISTARRIIVIAVAILGLMSLSAVAYAADDSGGKSGGPDASGGAGGKAYTARSNGSYSDSIPLSVPGFHNIAPGLALNYNSDAGNGWVGVGWSLSGISVIERVGPHRGAPVYDNHKDSFTLNGDDLIACDKQTTKSVTCKDGGNFSTKYESYERINLGTDPDPKNPGGMWTVWEKDGTKLIYKPIASEGTGGWDVYKWGLTEVVDSFGNRVDYRWLEPGWFQELKDEKDTPSCYWDVRHSNSKLLYSIHYNYADKDKPEDGAYVRIYYQGRPDVETLGDGRDQQRQCARIKLVDVKFNDHRQHAYQLNYNTSDETGRSRLKSVQPYDRFAKIDGSTGNYTGEAGGTPVAVKPTVFGWSNGQSNLQYFRNGDWDSSKTIDSVTGVLKGSGSEDTIRIAKRSSSCSGNFIDVYVGTATAPTKATSIPYTDPTARGCTSTYRGSFAGDVNGDGYTDLIFSIANDKSGCITFYALIANGRGGFNDQIKGKETGACSSNLVVTDRWLSADVNGDGKTDMLQVWKDGDQAKVNVWKWNYNPNKKPEEQELFSYKLSTASFGNYDDSITRDKTDLSGKSDLMGFMTGDVNGDGRTDIYDLRKDGEGKFKVYVYQSDGDQFPSLSVTQDVTQFDYDEKLDRRNWFVGDINGDGKSDLVKAWKDGQCPTGGDAAIDVWRSNGSNGFKGALTSCLANTQLGELEFHQGDFNGDGKTDFATFWKFNNHVYDEVILARPLLDANCKSDDLGKGCLFKITQSKFLDKGGNEVDWYENDKDPGSPDASRDPSFLIADADGNGSSDVIYANKAAKGHWYVYLTRATAKTDLTNSVSDLLTKIGNNCDGNDLSKDCASKVGIDYEPSSLAGSPQNNAPISQTVKFIQSDIMRASADNFKTKSTDSSVTQFQYWNNKYDFANRRPLGFKYVNTILPAVDNAGVWDDTTKKWNSALAGANPSIYTEFSQDPRSLSKVMKQWTKNGLNSGAKPAKYRGPDTRNIKPSVNTGQIVSAAGHEYKNSGDGVTSPYISLQTGQESWSCDPHTPLPGKDIDRGKCQGSRQENTEFNSYGDVTKSVNLGDANTDKDGTNLGDDIRTLTTYESHIDNSHNLVDLPAEVRTCSADGFSNTDWCEHSAKGLLGLNQTAYDAANNYAPKTGSAWLDTKNGFVTTTTKYDGHGNLLETDGPDGEVSTTGYDPYGRPTHASTKVSDSATQNTYTNYDDSQCGLPSSTIGINGENGKDSGKDKTSITYDALCRVKTSDDSSTSYIDETHDYSNFDKAGPGKENSVITTTVGPNGNPINSYSYTDGAGRTIKTASGPFGKNWLVAYKTYNARGQVIWSQAPHYQESSDKWDKDCHLHDQVCASKTFYDSLDRPTRVFTNGSDGPDHKWNGTDDADDTPSADSYTYYGDAARGVMTIDPLMHATNDYSDVYGNKIDHVEYRHEDDDTGNGVHRYKTHNDYDLNGNLLKTTATKVNSSETTPNVTTYSYDSLGRLKKRVDPDWGVSKSTYSDGGKTLTSTDAKKNEVDFTYDLLGRTLKKTYYDKDHKISRPSACWIYDRGNNAKGKVTDVYDQVKDNDCSKSDGEANYKVFEYDEQGNVKTEYHEIADRAFVFSYSYYPDGTPQSTTYPDDSDHDRQRDTIGDLTYDGWGRLQSIKAPTGDILNSVSYDQNDRPIDQVLANGADIKNSYSAAQGWQFGIKATTGSTSPKTMQDLTYQYDVGGRVKQVRNSADTYGTWDYGYDDLNQMTGATNYKDPSALKAKTLDEVSKQNSSTYSYDGFGNTLNRTEGDPTKPLQDRTRIDYSYPPAKGDDGSDTVSHPHAVAGTTTCPAGVDCKADPSKVKPSTYNYDDAGQMDNRNGQTLEFNEDHLPKKVTNSDGTTINYTYDADGNRVEQKVIDKDGTTVKEDTLYVADDYEVRLDTKNADHSNEQVIKYVSGPSGTLAKITGKPNAKAGDNGYTPVTYWLLSDMQGSLQKILDKDGNEVGNQLYQPYGKTLNTGGTDEDKKKRAGEFANESRGYTGQRLDKQTADSGGAAPLSTCSPFEWSKGCSLNAPPGTKRAKK